MSLTTWEVYWITRLDNVSIMLYLVLMAFAVIAVISGIAVGTDGFDGARKKCLILGVIGMVNSLALFVMLPSTKEMAAIIILPKIVNSEIVSEKLPKDANVLYDLATKYLKGKLTNKEGK